MRFLKVFGVVQPYLGHFGHVDKCPLIALRDNLLEISILIHLMLLGIKLGLLEEGVPELVGAGEVL